MTKQSIDHTTTQTIACLFRSSLSISCFTADAWYCCIFFCSPYPLVSVPAASHLARDTWFTRRVCYIRFYLCMNFHTLIVARGSRPFPSSPPHPFYYSGPLHPSCYGRRLSILTQHCKAKTLASAIGYRNHVFASTESVYRWVCSCASVAGRYFPSVNAAQSSSTGQALGMQSMIIRLSLPHGCFPVLYAYLTP